MHEKKKKENTEISRDCGNGCQSAVLETEERDIFGW